MKSLHYVICHIIPIALIACAWLIKTSKENSNNKMFIYVFCELALIFTIRAITLHFGIASSSAVSNNLLFLSLFIVTLFSVYPLRQLLPKLLNSWHLMMIFIPSLALVSILYLASIVGFSFPQYDPLVAIVKGRIWHFHILIRCAILLTTIIISLLPAIVSLKACSNKYVRIYSLAIPPFFGMIAILIFLFSQHIYIIATLFQVATLIFACSTTYYLLKQEKSTSTATDRHSTQEKSVESEESKLWKSLEECMKKQEPWRNPNIKLNELATMVASNRTTISATIHDHGYETFHEYIAQYRIEAFCRLVEENNYVVSNISQLFSQVGFQSLSSAFKHFKRIHNMTPSQYVSSKGANREE